MRLSPPVSCSPLHNSLHRSMANTQCSYICTVQAQLALFPARCPSREPINRELITNYETGMCFKSYRSNQSSFGSIYFYDIKKYFFPHFWCKSKPFGINVENFQVCPSNQLFLFVWNDVWWWSKICDWNDSSIGFLQTWRAHSRHNLRKLLSQGRTQRCYFWNSSELHGTVGCFKLQSLL